MKLLRHLIFGLCLVNILGCSTQWRDGDDGLQSDEVLTSLEAIQESAGVLSTDSLSEFQELMENAGRVIFFGYSDLRTHTSLGPPWSIAALKDLRFMGLEEDVRARDLSAAMVAYVEVPSEGRSVLAIDMLINGDDAYHTEFFASDAPAQISDEEYVVFVSNEASTLKLVSQDVVDGALDTVIQFKVYDIDDAGQAYYIGKFSTLLGYGN